jgi:hypothetical protein
MVLDGGKIAYVKEGRKYDGGFLGGDIEEAVKGDRVAEQYASEYKSGMVTGFALYMLAVAGVIGGAVLTGAESAQQPQSAPVPGLLVMAGGLVLDLAALGVMLSAQPHLYDAINAYNDGAGQSGAPSETPSTDGR